MAGFETGDTMPKMGHVTDLRERWLVRADGALAHRLQDREISSHLCENRSRNQIIREDFPVALSEQRGIEHEARMRELARHKQAEIDAELAREIAEINLRRQRRQNSTDFLQQPSSSRAVPPPPPPQAVEVKDDLNPEELGLSPFELEEMRRRLQQEEIDARIARELSHEVEDEDALMADMRYAVEAQDSELARLLQEREYRKLQRAKEKAKQKALLKKQQRLAAQQQTELPALPDEAQQQTQATLLDAYSNPRDMIREQKPIRDQNGLRLCKSVDSDLHYVEPFEKEQIQSKASALQAKELSKQYYPTGSPSRDPHGSHDVLDHTNTPSQSMFQHRQPPPPPTSSKKPRFPDPVSIKPASHYPMDAEVGLPIPTNKPNFQHSYSENNNLYNSTFSSDHGSLSSHSRSMEGQDPSKRLSVISDITPEGLAKRNIKQAELNKKRKGCKIQ